VRYQTISNKLINTLVARLAAARHSNIIPSIRHLHPAMIQAANLWVAGIILQIDK